MKSYCLGLASICLLLLVKNPPVLSEKILAVAFMSSKSHKIVYEPLLMELAKRGHEVTIVTPVDSKKVVKNVREIVTIDFEKSFKDFPNFFEMKARDESVNPFTMLGFFHKLCDQTYDLPQVKELLNEKFDLIISQPLFNECVLGFTHHFNTSLVLISPISAPAMFSSVTGHRPTLSFTPHFFLPFVDKMTYYERMVNFGFTLFMNTVHEHYYKPKMEQLYREKLGNPNIPSVNEILSNTSLVLSNGHFALSPPKAFLPDVVEVGGMHCRPAQPLPKDLQDFLDSSGEDGFIYFSMGSAIPAHTMPEKLRKTFVNVFSKLKQKVLWKWETEEMPDLPKNVKLGKWLPQQDILGHPKIRMFITHGGLGGTTEAVYHGVPLLGIPMFGDQLLNMQQSEKSGFATRLEFNDITEDTFQNAINKILNEPSFHEKVKALSKVFRDMPDKPLDRAVFWTEYVMRHKGAVHMRSAARDLNFFQYHSLDIIASYGVILYVIVYLVFIVLRFLWGKLCGFSKSSEPRKSQKHSSKKTN